MHRSNPLDPTHHPSSPQPPSPEASGRRGSRAKVVLDSRAEPLQAVIDSKGDTSESAGFHDVYEPAYAWVRLVPAGKVVTYGQVAGSVTEVSLTARQVGTAMRYAPDDVPWQRVVGAGGTLPIHKLAAEMAARQRRLLEQEGVVFLPERADRIDMNRCQWLPELDFQTSDTE